MALRNRSLQIVKYLRQNVISDTFNGCGKRLYSHWTDRRGYQHFEQRGRPFSRRGHLSNPKVLAVLAGGGGIIYLVSLEEIPYTKRRHSILVSASTERALGDSAFEQVVKEAQLSRTLLRPNSRPALQVRNIAQRITAVAGDGFGGGYQEHLKNLQWEVAVIDSPQVNAFFVPGGKIVVYTGLMKMVSSEDELAAVLAHEVAHIVARHGAERLTQGSFLQLLSLIAYWSLGIPIPDGALTALFFLPNSRKAETEADIIGVQLAARACFDPKAAVSMFTKLGLMESKAGGDVVPKFLRTHPVTDERIKAIKKMLGVAQDLYRANGCNAQSILLERLSMDR